MSIRWDDVPSGSAARRLPIPVWHVPRGFTETRQAYVRLLGPWRSVWLHWTNEGRVRTVPCRKAPEKCPYCPRRSFRHGYAPGAWWKGDAGNTQGAWSPIVCGIPDRMMDALEGQNAAGLLVAFWRERCGDQSYVNWSVLDNQVKELPLAWFDVEPILTQWWGYQSASIDFAREVQDREAAWRKDLADLIPQAPPADRPAVEPPRVVVPLPPIAGPIAGTTPTRPTETFAQTRARLEAERQAVEAARARGDVLSLPQAEPEVPKAAKRPRKSRKGGA